MSDVDGRLYIVASPKTKEVKKPALKHDQSENERTMELILAVASLGALKISLPYA